MLYHRTNLVPLSTSEKVVGFGQVLYFFVCTNVVNTIRYADFLHDRFETDGRRFIRGVVAPAADGSVCARRGGELALRLVAPLAAVILGDWGRLGRDTNGFHCGVLALRFTCLLVVGFWIVFNGCAIFTLPRLTDVQKKHFKK